MYVYEFDIQNKFGNVPLYARSCVFDRRTGDYTYPNRAKQICMPDKINCFHTHVHAPVEMIYIRDGELVAYFGDEVVMAKEGDLLVANPYQPHGAMLEAVQDHVRYSFVVFAPERFAISGMEMDKVSNTVQDYAAGRLSCVNYIRGTDDVREIGLMICRISELFAVQDGSGIAESRMMAYVHLIFAGLLEAGYLKRNNGGTVGMQFSRQMMDFLDSHYTEDITPELLKEYFPYHPSYFCRLFRQTFGKTFRQYLGEYRIQHAIFDYLSAGEGERLAIGEIASRVGFSDVNYFSRLFKSLTGLTPSEYLQRNAAGG